jgi:hypothetical protein
MDELIIFALIVAWVFLQVYVVPNCLAALRAPKRRLPPVGAPQNAPLPTVNAARRITGTFPTSASPEQTF